MVLQREAQAWLLLVQKRQQENSVAGSWRASHMKTGRALLNLKNVGDISISSANHGDDTVLQIDQKKRGILLRG